MKESMDPPRRYYYYVWLDMLVSRFGNLEHDRMMVWIWEGGVPPPSQIKFGTGGPSGLEQSRTSSVRRFMHLERSGTI